MNVCLLQLKNGYSVLKNNLKIIRFLFDSVLKVTIRTFLLNITCIGEKEERAAETGALVISNIHKAMFLQRSRYALLGKGLCRMSAL